MDKSLRDQLNAAHEYASQKYGQTWQFNNQSVFFQAVAGVPEHDDDVKGRPGSSVKRGQKQWISVRCCDLEEAGVDSESLIGCYVRKCLDDGELGDRFKIACAIKACGNPFINLELYKA